MPYANLIDLREVVFKRLIDHPSRANFSKNLGYLAKLGFSLKIKARVKILPQAISTITRIKFLRATQS
jgi:hypothetical protein